MPVVVQTREYNEQFYKDVQSIVTIPVEQLVKELF
jgi:hypothetical protein